MIKKGEKTGTDTEQQKVTGVFEALKREARILALQNAVKHKGVANAKALVGGIIGRHPEFKKEVGDLLAILERVVKEVNKLQIEEQERELREINPDFEKKRKKEEPKLKPLPGTETLQGKVVLRFEPSPSGPLHIGHAYPLSLNLEYAKEYRGAFILRIADTNPENISADSYELITKDASWLAEEELTPIIQSDRVHIYHRYAERLLKEGKAYVCTCAPEAFKKMKDQGEACPCRTLSEKEQMMRWQRMLSRTPDSYSSGEAVVRFKSDISHKNPAMRDFPILRINEAEHPRQKRKYRVWPLMNFSVAIDDLELGVTHTLRGKDHADNAKKQALIHEALGHATPVALSVGRINFEGFPVSCSKTRPRIESGEFTGWDDPRIPFLPALRRRGYSPRALRQYAVDVGLSKNDKSVALGEFFKHINALNKEIIDPVAERYFFIADPVEIIVNDAPNMECELDKHPDNKKGGRHFKTNKEYFLSGEDFNRIEKELAEGQNERIRFMDNITVLVKKESGALNFFFDRKEYVKSEVKRIVHWLPAEEHEKNLLKATVIMPDASRKHGLAESSLKSVSVDDVVQLERFGFCRLDARGKERAILYYAHR